MHQLQSLFASEEGETAWTQDLHALFGAGAFDEAEAQLAEALTALDTELAWTCLELPREAVVLSGWEELGEAIAMHEGEPVTGVTIAIANEGDRDFQKGTAHRPHVLLGIYTDEAFDFSRAVHWQLIDECHSEQPSWAGKEEDIEVHMDIDGLDRLNTLLIHHKQRYFFREAEGAGGPGHAPLRYVEYVVASWWRALRWHQAVATECAIHGLPHAVPVIAGMVDMRPEAVAVHHSGGEGAKGTGRPQLALASIDGVPTMAGSMGDGFIQRRAPIEEVAPPSVSDLRRRAQATAPREGDVLDKPRRASLLARIFGRS